MTPKEAKAELNEILKQKTVSISRLKKILNVIDYERLEKQYIRQGKSIRNKKKENHQLLNKIRELKEGGAK